MTKIETLKYIYEQHKADYEEAVRASDRARSRMNQSYTNYINAREEVKAAEATEEDR